MDAAGEKRARGPKKRGVTPFLFKAEEVLSSLAREAALANQSYRKLQHEVKEDHKRLRIILQQRIMAQGLLKLQTIEEGSDRDLLTRRGWL